MSALLNRFLRYVKIDTRADESSSSSPSSAKQLNLSRMLLDECQELGLTETSLNEYGIVLATIPSNVDHVAPTIAWVAHVDTSPEFTADNVKPQVHNNYQGQDLVLPGDPTRILKVAENPALAKLVGKTIITTDGTTLLGADDKSGIAAIMTAAESLMSHPEIKHGPIKVCFTVDEEIGRGTEHLDLSALASCCAYTLDSDGAGKLDLETFSADLAIVSVTGINTHPSEGKGRMVNALRILGEFLTKLPQDKLAPEVTDGREGFLHPYHLDGGVAQASLRIILRDFETSALHDHAQLLQNIAHQLEAKYPRCQINITIKKQYRNMRDGLIKEPRASQIAIQAYRNLGIEPEISIIRGGTDGSLLTELGLPTPNLSSGQHNPHSPLEWTCLEEMEAAAQMLVELAKLWGEQTA